MNLTTATPVEIDTLLAALDTKRWDAAAKVSGAKEGVMYAAGAKRNYYAKTWNMKFDDALDALCLTAANDDTYKGAEAQRKIDRLNEAEAAVTAIDADIAPLEAEFDRRGGWTRAFLAQAANGHIHSSQHCGSCYPTTRYFWFVGLSGHDEAEIVTKAGSDACTYCYPTAPVNDLKRPRSIFSDDEVAAQRDREARAAAKAARDAKRIEKALTADGSEFLVEWTEVRGGHDRDANGNSTYVTRPRRQYETFKTEQAATQWVVQQMCWGHVTEGQHGAMTQIVEAIATKHGQTVEEVRTMVAGKVAAKNKRDAR